MSAPGDREARIAKKTAWLVERLAHPDDCDCSAECRRLLDLKMRAHNATLRAFGYRPLEVDLDALNRCARLELGP